MEAKFSTDVRFNHNMGLLETLSFQGEGVGAALYVVAAITGQLPIAVLGIAFVLGAVLALRAHLGQPTRGWRALSRLRTAWVSRGTLVIGAFVGFSVLAVAATYVGFLQPFQSLLATAALIFAVPVIVYAGMLLRSMRAIRLWRSLSVPLSFSAHSAATALAIACVLAPWLRPSAIGALVIAAAMSAVHLLLIEPSAGTQASLRRLLQGDLRGKFIGGAGVFGLAVPLLGLIGSWPLSASMGPEVTRAVLAVLALLRLYGDFAYRYSIVLAGAYEPIFPAEPNRPFPNHQRGNVAIRGA
jgi:formate-dependent nitrite reductase membrane component NrfD